MSDESTTEIRELYDRLLAAWNGRDAEKFAAFFGTDGVSIGFDGSTATGPEIRDHLAGVFDDHSTASYVAKVREVRQLGADTVLLRAIVGMLPPGADRLKPDVTPCRPSSPSATATAGGSRCCRTRQLSTTGVRSWSSSTPRSCRSSCGRDAELRALDGFGELVLRHL